MKRLLLVGAGALWFLLVFFVSFRLTFPSDAVADRIRYEVQETTDGAWVLDLRSVRPWWIGAAADGIRVFKAEPGGEQTLAMAADSAKVRVGLTSLMRQTPRVSGSLQLGSGDIDFTVGTRVGSKGDLGVSEIALNGSALPITEIAALAGTDLDGQGTVDVKVGVDAPDGMRTANGQLSIRGSALQITQIDLSSLGVPELGLEIPIQELDLTFDIAEGTATVARGIVRGGLATIEIQGTIGLRDALDRSVLDLTILVGSLGPQLQPFKGFLGDEWPDGKFHYKCTGQVSRSNCRAERNRAASARSRPLGVGNNAGARGARQAGRKDGVQEAPGAMDDEERAKRREELRERLRQRREQARERAEADRIVEDDMDPGGEEYEYDDEDEPLFDDEDDDELYEDDDY